MRNERLFAPADARRTLGGRRAAPGWAPPASKRLS